MMILLELSYSSRPSMNLGCEDSRCENQNWDGLSLNTDADSIRLLQESFQKLGQLNGKHLKIEFSWDCVHPAT